LALSRARRGLTLAFNGARVRRFIHSPRIFLVDDDMSRVDNEDSRGSVIVSLKRRAVSQIATFRNRTLVGA